MRTLYRDDWFGAVTLVGSGSVAAQPVFEALFAKYEKLHKNIEFVYTANGGNVGVQDVQAGRTESRILLLDAPGLVA